MHENEPVGGTHFRTKTRFETEAKDNSEMTYLIQITFTIGALDASIPARALGLMRSTTQSKCELRKCFTKWEETGKNVTGTVQAFKTDE